MSDKRFFGFGEFGAWVRSQVAEVTDLVAAKLGVEDTAANSHRLEGKTLAEVISRITHGDASFAAPAVGFTPFASYRYNTSGQNGIFKVEDGFVAGFNMNLVAPNENGELVYDFDGLDTRNVQGHVYGQNSSGVYQDYEASLDVPGNKVQNLRLEFTPTVAETLRVTVNTIGGSGQDGFYFRAEGGSKALYEGDPFEFTVDPNAVSGYTNPLENARNINYLEISAFKGTVNAIAYLSHVNLVLERLVDGQWVNLFLTGSGGLSLDSLVAQDSQLAQRIGAVETGKLDVDAQAADSAQLAGHTVEHFATADAVAQLEADVNTMLTDLTAAFNAGADKINAV